MSHTVQVSMWPGRYLEVDDIEYAQLKAQGLLIESLDEATAEVKEVAVTKSAPKPLKESIK